MSYNIKKVTIIEEIPLSINTLPIKELSYYKEHRRLKLFYNKGTTCVKYGKVGTHLKICKLPNGAIHLDIFTDKNEMLTVDHIIPISKGENRLDINNLQVMCSKCNSKKGNTLEI